MWEILQYTIPNNLGVVFEVILLLVINVLGLIPYAKDFKLGLILSFLANGLLFMGLHALGLNYVLALVLCLMFLVMLCFSLYASGSAQTTSGIT